MQARRKPLRNTERLAGFNGILSIMAMKSGRI
jgi:hypothetical protein